MKDKGRTITKVGITGAGGRIGRNLTEGLTDKYELTLIIRNSQPDTSRNLKIVKADLSKEEEVKGIFEGLDAVIHLAANASPLAPWGSILQDNIVATYNVLEEVRRAGVKRVIFASTNHVQDAFAMTREIPFTSDPPFTKSGRLIKSSDPPAPDSYYGVSKLFGEDLGRYYSLLYGLEFISVRIGWAVPKVVSPIWNSLKRNGETTEMLIRGAIFFSPRDCVDLFTKTLEVETDFLIVYGVSNTRNPIFDLTETKEILGYNPQDNEEEYLQRGSTSL